MPHKLTSAQDEVLVSELSAALEQMVDRSCMEMAPSWLSATQRSRSELMSAEMSTPFEPSPRFLNLGRSCRSKYRSLAVWRHALLWKQVLPKLQQGPRRALEAVYFTPFPDNAPPYAYSKSAAKAPAIKDFDGPRALKRLARRGAELSVLALREEVLAQDGSVLGELSRALMRPAVSTTAHDVLKLERSDSYGKPLCKS